MARRILVLLGLLVLMVGCGARSTTALRPQDTPAASLERLAAQAWETIPLPVPDTFRQVKAFGVSPRDPATLFVCSGPPESPTPQPSSAGIGPIELWRSADLGLHWTLVPLGALGNTIGGSCSISIARDRPQRILFNIGGNLGEQRPCERDTLYLSDDGGATWRHIVHPTRIPAGVSMGGNCIPMASAHHLYTWSEYQDHPAGSLFSLLDRSDDLGKTWIPIDAAFGPGAHFVTTLLGDGESLVTGLIHDTRCVANPAGTGCVDLYLSHDAGTTWRHVGPSAGDLGPTVFGPQSPDVSAPLPGLPFYDLRGDQNPESLYSLHVFASEDTQNWQPLPPLPIPGTTTDLPGILQALAVTASGHLLAFGPDPASGVPDPGHPFVIDMPAFWLYSWDPHTARWQVLSAPLSGPGNVACGGCWYPQLATSMVGSATYLYVHHYALPLGLLRLRLPAEIS
jgi:hypothetical protein